MMILDYGLKKGFAVVITRAHYSLVDAFSVESRDWRVMGNLFSDKCQIARFCPWNRSIVALSHLGVSEPVIAGTLIKFNNTYRVGLGQVPVTFKNLSKHRVVGFLGH